MNPSKRFSNKKSTPREGFSQDRGARTKDGFRSRGKDGGRSQSKDVGRGRSKDGDRRKSKDGGREKKMRKPKVFNSDGVGPNYKGRGGGGGAPSAKPTKMRGVKGGKIQKRKR